MNETISNELLKKLSDELTDVLQLNEVEELQESNASETPKQR